MSIRKMSTLIAMCVASVLFAAVGAATAQENPATAPTQEQMQAMAEKAAALGLPEGVIQLTPCVPAMGEHWADPANMPFGPIYGVMNDQVVFVEIMPSQEAFAQGESWPDVLKPVAGKVVDHVDFEFEAHGHEGYPVPHYDIHAYFVPHAVHEAYCPAQ
jgi:hypothetical protein